jgi:alpha-1,3(6)-mannosylglycoprotein beta-1,6-N-acetyl-glucosaminyltransferase
VIKKYVDIHATVFVNGKESAVLPNFINNHGILSGPNLHRLLKESKLFIGLGFPYEGPAPLEAIAHGCAFINPKFNPPHNALNTKFFQGKPTHRLVTSQHPYAEDFISEPHVYTVDMDNLVAVEDTIKKALAGIDDNKVGMYLPYEFTHEGMMQRLNAYIQHQDFCTPHPEIWPPVASINITASKPGMSCKDVCWKQGQICEPSHFKRLNSKSILEQHLGNSCASVEEKADIYFPGYEPSTRKCFLQKDSLLFSCVGEIDGLVKICPCRNYIKGQTALCPDCL